MVKESSVYSLHPGLGTVGRSERNLLDRTGKDLAQWVEFLRLEGPASEKEQRDWLKAEHGITTNYAMWIVEETAGRGLSNYDPEALVEAQYSGKKEGLRPIYEELLRIGLTLGPDVKACPCATIVPLYRKNVFAQIKPTTNTRIDLGFCLRGVAATGRLLDTGGEARGDRITHRIPIASLTEIDAEVRHWFERAYQGG
jgi:hypothetical protein